MNEQEAIALAQSVTREEPQVSARIERSTQSQEDGFVVEVILPTSQKRVRLTSTDDWRTCRQEMDSAVSQWTETQRELATEGNNYWEEKKEYNWPEGKDI